MIEKKLYIKKKKLQGFSSQTVDLDFDRIFTNIPRDFEPIKNSEKYFITGDEIVYTVEIRRKTPTSPFPHPTLSNLR